MRRIVIAIALSIAAVAPGIAWHGDQERPPSRNRGQHERPRSPVDARTSGQETGANGARIRTEGRDFGPDFGPDLFGPACVSSFGTDFSSQLFNAPGNGWVVVDRDCSGVPGCDDYFIVTCPQGNVVQASFCSNGGGASWNTSLSAWDNGALQQCEDDTCGQQSEIAYAYTGNNYQRMRVGGTGGESGSYSLAVNIPANCFVGPPIGVELQSFDLGSCG